MQINDSIRQNKFKKYMLSSEKKLKRESQQWQNHYVFSLYTYVYNYYYIFLYVCMLCLCLHFRHFSFVGKKFYGKQDHI